MEANPLTQPKSVAPATATNTETTTTPYRRSETTPPAAEPARAVRRPRPRVLPYRRVREFIGTLVFVVALFTLLQLAMPRSIVHGRSMQPNLAEGQRLVISRVHYLFGEPERGDIIVFNSPAEGPDDPPLIKRVIGLPGDTIEIRDTMVYVNGELLDEPYINEPCNVGRCRDNNWTLGPGQYFMMGDNRNHSNDSRAFGAVPAENIIGEALLRFWPLQDIGIIQRLEFPQE